MATRITINKTPETITIQPPFQGQQSFIQRLIEITIELASDAKSGQPISFAGSEGKTVTLSGHRTSVRIENNGAPAGSNAHVSIYGLIPSLMNQLTTLGIIYNQIQRNKITISAGDAIAGMTPVFTGTIVQAYGDYNSAPDVALHIECQTGTADATAPAAASSFTGATDVATIMAGFARQMNVGFENNGITAQLSNPYFAGNLNTQMQKAAQHANINAEIINGKLCIWPKGGSRNSSGAVPLISKLTGMILYPTYTPQGILVKMLFNPQISFGTTIQVESSIKFGAKTPERSVIDIGSWIIWKLDLALDSLIPHGNWMGSAYCYAKGFPAPIPPK